MKPNYFEYIVVYLSVLVACVLIGALARLFVVGAGADEFTANIVFWAVTALGVIAYAVLNLLIEGLFTATVKKFFPKKEISKTTNTSSEIPQSLEAMRAEQRRAMEDKKCAKKEFAVHYTRKEFAPYLSDKDMEQLCRYVELYSEQHPLSDIQPVKVKDLSTLDIYHFGWNIWKYFNVGRQEDIALFLKKVFAELLKDVEPESIKSHLKDDPRKGIILIQEKLRSR